VATDADGVSRTGNRDLVYRSSQLLTRKEKGVCILEWYFGRENEKQNVVEGRLYSRKPRNNSSARRLLMAKKRRARAPTSCTYTAGLEHLRATPAASHRAAGCSTSMRSSSEHVSETKQDETRRPCLCSNRLMRGSQAG
jgi:hypothetical protein